MKIQTLFFGMSKDLTGTNAISFDLDKGISVKEFRQFLQQKYPLFSEMDAFAIAVNESYAEEGLVLSDNDIVAVIPPVSGG